MKDANDALIEGFDIMAAADGAALYKPKRDPSWSSYTYTAASLQQRIFSPTQWIIPGLIPEGLTILAGKPKVGKSWLILDGAVSVAAMRACFGDLEPEQGDVLYCALEDNARRLQDRLTKLLPTFDGQWPERLTLTNRWERLNANGVHHIKEWAQGVPKPRLVILDTLAGVKPINTRDGYAADYAALEGLHALANELRIAIVVLHHLRKAESEDPLDSISGTLGLAGCADTLIVIQRNTQGTTLYVRGRDIEEAEHAVEFNKRTCRWTLLGNASDVRRSSERGRILAVFDDNDDALGPNEIAAEARMKSDNVRYLVGQMVRAGDLIKEGRGKYRRA